MFCHGWIRWPGRSAPDEYSYNVLGAVVNPQMTQGGGPGNGAAIGTGNPRAARRSAGDAGPKETLPTPAPAAAYCVSTAPGSPTSTTPMARWAL